MFLIKIPIQSTKRDVNKFISQLKLLLNDTNFDIDTNLIIINKKKTPEKEMFSTPYTLLDLEYDNLDIVDRLKELTLQNYTETLYDNQDDNPPHLFVFGKYINNKQVYIKLKIKDVHRKVLCLSFHYAEFPMKFPY